MRFETLNKSPPRDSGLPRLRGHRDRHRAFAAGPESRRNEPAALYRQANTAIEKIAIQATNAAPVVRLGATTGAPRSRHGRRKPAPPWIRRISWHAFTR